MSYSTKQDDKYGNGFERDLKTSDVLVQLTRKAFEQYDQMLIMDKFDERQLTNERTGKALRLADLMVFDTGGLVRPVFPECKDFGRLVCWASTGLPRRYVDERMSPLGAENVVFVFCDNIKVVKAIAEREEEDDLMSVARRMHFCSVNGDSVEDISFMPYGGVLSELMGWRDSSAESRVPSNFKGYYGEKQYIWRLSGMRPLPELVRSIVQPGV